MRSSSSLRRPPAACPSFARSAGRSLTAALVLALAITIGGCAGSDADAARNAYVIQINDAQRRLAVIAEQVAGEITHERSLRRERRTLVHYGAVVGDLVKSLRTGAVPVGVRSEHAGLVGALVTFRREISAVVVELRSPATTAIDDAHQRLTDATKTLDVRLDAALGSINRKLKAG